MFLHAKEAYKILNVPNFSYLGITFSKSGSFNAAKKDLVNKGTKAMYEVLKKGRLHQYEIIRTLMSMSIGYRPNSP
jgi:hypothetical protein